MTGGWRRRASDDTGASLILALVLVTFLGLVIGALLSYSSASVRATAATDGRAVRTYDAGGALQTAINHIRTGSFNNDAGTACPDLTVPGSDGTPSTVTCTAAAGTGAGSERVPITSANRPGQAVLTVGTNSGEPGIAQQSGTAFRVQGKVFSAGTVTTGTGTLESIDSKVTARGTCTGTVVSRDARGNVVPSTCSAPAASIPADPNYGRSTAGLTYRTLPPCTTGSTVEFSPGYYDDAVGLSDMMDGVGPCAGKTFLFRSATSGIGNYYFDFHNGEGPGLPAGSRVWTVDDPNAAVVAGTPRGWTPDASTPVVPGACVSPLTATANNGVQFVFGGDSRLSVQAGSVELCGQYSATAPPIALYGVKTGADTVTGPSTLATDGTGTNPTDGPPFANPQLTTATDGSPATAVIDAMTTTGPVTASILVKGFAVSLPAGTVLSAAKLVVVHRDDNADATSTLSLLQVSVTPSRTGAPALTGVPQPTIYQDGPTGTGAYHKDTLDLLPSLANEVHTNGFTGLRVRYDASVPAGAKVTENLDSMQLVLTYRRPALRGQRTAVNGTVNCIGKYPAGCHLLETDATDTAVHVQGTLYAPYATVDLRPANATAAVVASGLVVRAMQNQSTAGPSYGGPLVKVPNDSGGPAPLEVYLRAYRSGKVVATARVRFPATDPIAPPTPGRRNVTVLSWTIRRN